MVLPQCISDDGEYKRYINNSDAPNMITKYTFCNIFRLQKDETILFYLLNKENEVIIGIARCFESNPDFSIAWINIIPEYGSLGYGNLLLLYIIVFAHENDYQYIKLEDASDYPSFYLGVGFIYDDPIGGDMDLSLFSTHKGYPLRDLYANIVAQKKEQLEKLGKMAGNLETYKEYKKQLDEFIQAYKISINDYKEARKAYSYFTQPPWYFPIGLTRAMRLAYKVIEDMEELIYSNSNPMYASYAHSLIQGAQKILSICSRYDENSFKELASYLELSDTKKDEMQEIEDELKIQEYKENAVLNPKTKAKVGGKRKRQKYLKYKAKYIALKKLLEIKY